jgi:hypothetical protein
MEPVTMVVPVPRDHLRRLVYPAIGVSDLFAAACEAFVGAFT